MTHVSVFDPCLGLLTFGLWDSLDVAILAFDPFQAGV